MAQVPFSNKLKTNALGSQINSTTSTYPLQPTKIGGTSTAQTNSGGFLNDMKNLIGGTANKVRQGGSVFGSTPVKTPTTSTTSGTIKGVVATPTPVTHEPIKPAVTTNQTTSTTQSPVAPPVNTPPPTQSTQPTTFSGMVGSLANQSGSQFNQSTQNSINGLQGIANNQNQYAATAQKGLQNIATNQTPEVTNSQKDYNSFAQSSPYMLAAQHNPNVAASIASGRASLLGQTFGQILGAKAQGVSNALSGQGQQINAGEGAGNLALNSQAQQITAGQNAGSLAQIGQSTSQSGLGTAASYAQPHFNGYVALDPQTGQSINGGSINNAIQTGVNANTYEKQAGDYQMGLKNLRAADSLQSGIVATLASNPQLNQTPISAITNLKQWLAGQTSDPAQQVLAQQVANYVQALGFTPEQAAQIALQKGGTIGTLLDALRSTYEAQNNANLGNSQTNTTQSSSGGLYNW